MPALVGSSWILTANHAFEARQSDAVIFSGKEYQMRARAAVRLRNPDWYVGAEFSDLIMVPLLSEPDLPALKITEQTPFAEELVVMVGCGETLVDAGSAVILTGAPNNPEPLLRPISGESKGGADAGSRPRWGENEVAGRDLRVGVPGKEAETRAFVTIRQEHWAQRKAQGASGDSGGGVFVKRGEGWQLAGVMLNVLHREDLNASATFIGDLSVYRDQIEAAIPEPGTTILVGVSFIFFCLARRRSL